MAIITKKIGFTIDVDESVIAPASVEVWIYQMINRLNYEHPIKSVTVDDVTVEIDHPAQVAELSLGENKKLEQPEPIVSEQPEPLQ